MKNDQKIGKFQVSSNSLGKYVLLMSEVKEE